MGSDADLYLVIGVTASVVVGIIAGGLVVGGAPDVITYIVGAVGGVIASIVLSIGVIAKGVEIGNRS